MSVDFLLVCEEAGEYYDPEQSSHRQLLRGESEDLPVAFFLMAFRWQGMRAEWTCSEGGWDPHGRPIFRGCKDVSAEARQEWRKMTRSGGS